MFDVVWADPERELVGQRKARREIEKKESKDGRSSGSRSGTSVRSESSTQSRKPNSFLAAIRLKKKSKHTTQSIASSSRISGCSMVAGTQENGPSSPGLISRLRGGEPIQDAAGFHQDNYIEFSSSSQDRSSIDDSILSKWTAPISLMTMLSLDEEPAPEAEDKDPSSEATTKQTETTNEPPFETTALPPPQSPPATPVTQQDKISRPLQSSSSQLASQSKTPARNLIKPPAGSLLEVIRSTEVCPLSPAEGCEARHTPESWKFSDPPSSVMIGPESESSVPASSHHAENLISPSKDVHLVSLSFGLSGMQREVLKMAAASHETFLRRLTEAWGSSSDAALYKELETDKKRWMLSALYSINPPTNKGIARLPIDDRRILAFFESHATASYIAALNVGIPVHHMSPSPLSSRLFPNVSPMVFTAVPCMSISVAPHMFSDIYAQTLPVLISAGDIPLVLRSMHRVLKPQGTLHLILIDPLPVEATMGPQMRAWLDGHLLTNVERQFRCKYPTRQFLPWLRDAHFQLAEGAKVVCKFPAIVLDAADGSSSSSFNEATGDVAGDGKGKGKENAEKCEESEEDADGGQLRRLHSVVGQKLWQDMWGPYVTADQWWWEDALCREECLRLGTAWEYHILDAVKKSMAPGAWRT